jgi:hypothetical protein
VRVFLSSELRGLPCADPREEVISDAAGEFTMRLPAAGESLCFETEEGPALGYERRAGVDPATSFSLHCEDAAPLRVGGKCWLGKDSAPVVLGYVDEHVFLPLIAVVDSEFIRYDSWMKLSGELYDAFAAGGESIPIERQESYTVAGGSTEELGVVASPAQPGTFFAVGRAEPFPAERPSAELQSLFLGDEERPSDWRFGWVTDLDRNGRKELWVDRRLMYGESERIVFEQTASDSDGDWDAVASGCHGCD